MRFNIGRLDRLGFTVSMMVSFALIILLVLGNAPMSALVTFVYINFAWMLVVYAGRLHDVGHSGWWALLVMFTSVLGMIALAAWPGSKQTNKYGEVPPRAISHLLHFWRTPNNTQST
jgi:uncharacterized membrane protein YhaH (DUF805 family)